LDRAGAPVSARERLVAELREHALVIGEVTLSSGATASYYVDAKRAILRAPGFGALGELPPCFSHLEKQRSNPLQAQNPLPIRKKDAAPS